MSFLVAVGDQQTNKSEQNQKAYKNSGTGGTQLHTAESRQEPTRVEILIMIMILTDYYSDSDFYSDSGSGSGSHSHSDSY